MFAQVKSLIGRINYDRIFVQSRFFQVIEQLPHTFIHSRNTSQVIAHVTLIFEAYQFFSGRIFFPELFIDRLINRIPFCLLLWGKTGAGLVGHFQIPVEKHGVGNGHIIFCCGITCVVIVKQCFGLGESGILVHSQFVRPRLPRSMRSFMPHHYHKWLLRIFFSFQPVNRFVGNNFGGVPFHFVLPLLVNKSWIIIATLPWQNIKIIETGWRSTQM